MWTRRGGQGARASPRVRRHMSVCPLVQAKSGSDVQLAERIDSQARVLALQTRLVAALEEQVLDDDAELGAAVAELRDEPKELAALYNDYAAKYQVRWGSGMFHRTTTIILRGGPGLP
jgi:hypothetical protein